MDRLSILSEQIANFRKDRPTMAEHDSDPEVLAAYLVTEVREFVASFTEVTKLDRSKNIAQELADVLFLTISLADVLGIDLYAETMEKIALNLGRYQARYFQDGNYEENRLAVKAQEVDERVKANFYQELFIE